MAAVADMLSQMDLSPVVCTSDLEQTRWSIAVCDIQNGALLATHNPTKLLRTASVAKIFVLIELAARLAAGSLSPDTPLDRNRVEPVHDSGLWQHLHVNELPTTDVARLVGTLSDNWATNVLIDLLTLGSVQQRANSLCTGGTTLHDILRDERAGTTVPEVSHGSSADWVFILRRLATGTIVSPAVSAMVLDWISTSVDHSMVASAFHLDPLSPAHQGERVQLWNKTGTDAGVRADVGMVQTPDNRVAYAAIANWDAHHDDPRSAVMTAMRSLGATIAEELDEGQLEAL